MAGAKQKSEFSKSSDLHPYLDQLVHYLSFTKLVGIFMTTPVLYQSSTVLFVGLTMYFGNSINI